MNQLSSKVKRSLPQYSIISLWNCYHGHFFLIFYTSTPEDRVRGAQIDCLGIRSVTVIFGGWINGFDGSCRLKQRTSWRQQGWVWTPGSWMNVGLLGFVQGEGLVKNVRWSSVHHTSVSLLLDRVQCVSETFKTSSLISYCSLRYR